jgi:hypothetical protein
VTRAVKPVDPKDLGEPRRAMVQPRAATRGEAGEAGEERDVLELISRAARDPTVNVEKMQQLFALRERLEDRRAKQQFDAAIAAAKGEIGPIIKNRAVDFTSTRPGAARTNYRYEDFAAVAAAVDPVLARHGLSYRFRSDQWDKKIKVTCRVSHADGYGEDVTLQADNDESGNKNSIQAVGSAATYLQRYTLKLALGLAASNDEDGQTRVEDPVIDADQLAFIEQQLRDTDSDTAKFLERFSVPTLDALRVSQYKTGLGLIEKKKRDTAEAAKRAKEPAT